MKLLEFKDKDLFHEAALKLQKSDPTLQVFTPIPDDALMDKLEIKSPWIKRAAITGALVGFTTGFVLQYYTNVYSYTHNIGGRPLNSWPAFMLVSFELGILFSALSILGTFFFQNKLPRFDREVFAVESYNQNRHEHFFILTTKETSDVEAYKCHDISDPA